jgi:hypothetical protein
VLGEFFFSQRNLAAGTAASVVVVAAAANEDNDEKDNPGAVIATEEVISTHVRFLLFLISPYTMCFAEKRLQFNL